jgi:hypothetical protein
MKILEIELILCTRLALNNIRHLKLTLKEIVQLFLGTNGSGKSSLLYELSPLPANHKQYHKGGKKRILIAAHGKTYELISDFANGNDHYFYVDGENLNTGRTITIQKELVREHFGYTQEIHEILLGLEPFSRMPTSRRREVFTMLCSVDYTYAIKLYKKINEELRNTSGALKRTKERLVKETATALKDDEIAIMRSRLSDLNRESQSMYMLRNADAPTVYDAQQAAGQAIKAIQELTERFHSIRKLLRDKCYIAPDEYQMDIDDARHELSRIEGVYARLSEEFIKAASEVGSVSEMDAEDVVKLKDSIIADNNQARDLLAKRKKPLEGFNAVKATQSLDVVYESLYGVLTQIKADPQGLLNSQALNEVQDKIRERELSLSTNKEKLAGFEHREKHLVELGNSEEISCPKCEHQWKMGYSELEHHNLKGRITSGRGFVELLDKELKELREKRDELMEYANLYKEYIRITRSTPELQPLWDLISEEDALRQSPQHALTLVELIRSDLRIEMQVSAIREKITTDMKRLEMAEYAQSETVKGKKQRMDQLEQEIGQLSQQKLRAQEKLRDLTITQRQVKHMYEVSDKLNQAKSSLDLSSIQVVNAVKNEIIDEALADTHREIATLSSRIHSIDQHEHLINDLKNTIVELQKEEKAFKALADALSPTDGLIAEGMLGFIRNFVARWNALIAKIWTYRMEVHDCSTEEESAELNYKFPVTTPNLPKPTGDVNETSSGQKEMLDLGFRVVAAQCLGLDKGPLSLDEFGKTFDEAHQSAATQVILQLLEQLNFSQLFMISHYESCYGAFYNAQITVMDKRNITVPANRKFNEFTIVSSSLPVAEAA